MNKDSELRRLGHRIKDVRNQKHMTQTELAAVCKLNRNYIGMLERGERNPTYITLLRLANNLGMTITQLIG